MAKEYLDKDGAVIIQKCLDELIPKPSTENNGKMLCLDTDSQIKMKSFIDLLDLNETKFDKSYYTYYKVILKIIGNSTDETGDIFITLGDYET